MIQVFLPASSRLPPKYEKDSGSLKMFLEVRANSLPALSHTIYKHRIGKIQKYIFSSCKRCKGTEKGGKWYICIVGTRIRN